MKEWKHLTLEQRKVISSGISHENKLKQIGESLQVDPTSVSKEVKRNRVEVSIGLKNNCKRTNRWPYVCTGCNKKMAIALLPNMHMMPRKHNKRLMLI